MLFVFCTTQVILWQQILLHHPAYGIDYPRNIRGTGALCLMDTEILTHNINNTLYSYVYTPPLCIMFFAFLGGGERRKKLIPYAHA